LCIHRSSSRNGTLLTHSFLRIRSSAYSALEEHLPEVEGTSMVTVTDTDIDMYMGRTMDTDRTSIVHTDIDVMDMDPTAIMDKSDSALSKFLQHNFDSCNNFRVAV
uniref:Secreted protein n=1 Tax=Haemonchus placei TaxID=6290 RepID=A0A0N4X5F3_HAEPC